MSPVGTERTFGAPRPMSAFRGQDIGRAGRAVRFCPEADTKTPSNMSDWPATMLPPELWEKT